MKIKILLLLVSLSLFCSKISFGQLKVHPSNDYVKIGNIGNSPSQLLHIEDIAINTPGFLLEAQE